ncbi:hypothetical protein GQ43DRAFT_250192 [Delitschia confertaspora ATCC 74209]|uniref:Leucine Rich Repeat protein n=1 Tax=Delitschia confertaspora ATCC 74209 TaxID=1513339 RepID=A0A9P4JHH7_9PLEO|nr:hypothetical protein GQ43DRAFT_250192 [Delitschia confertaspora ATCC 74209]
MDTEDGTIFIKNLAYFVRTHEKALANALQLQRQGPRNGQPVGSPGSPTSTTTNATYSTSSVWAAALSLPSLTFTSPNIKPAKLTLTPHHLFYLLSRFEELNIAVGPMNVRLENIHTDASPTNYVSFLSNAQRNKSRGSDRDSIHSVSSIRSVMSGMSSLWSSLGLASNSAAKAEKQKAAIQEDLRYLYSAFTKIPCLRLAPDHKARLIAGYEEFPFDSAVPLFAFKNLSALEIYDVDFRQFYGWDRLAEQLRSLTVKRAGVDDPADLLINIVWDDIDKRRRRSAKGPGTTATPWPANRSPSSKNVHMARSDSPPSSPRATDKATGSLQSVSMARGDSAGSKAAPHPRQRSTSPVRPSSSRHSRSSTPNIRRSSGSSGSSARTATPRGSSSNLLSLGYFPSNKWRFLRHLSLADNALTNISVASLVPLANTLQSLDLSANLFTEIPDSLATLTALRALNFSSCMIESLHSLGRNPLPAITTLNLRSNRLTSLAGIERLLSLERVDLRDNKLTDPTEIARLTGVPYIQEIYVHRNPFCKSYGNYRTTIFNLFRKTPGYTEDVVIDTTGPSYSEKKQLTERVPELPSVPIMKPPPEDEVPPPPAPSKILFPQIEEPLTKPDEALDPIRRTGSHHASRSGHTVSHRGKKAPKRRIVELSQNETGYQAQDDTVATPQAHHQDSAVVEEIPSLDRAKRPAQNSSEPTSLASADKDKPQLLPLNTAMVTQLEPQPLTDPPEFDGSSDLYKKKMEALRHDFGNTWLSALGDEGWDTNALPNFPDREFSPPLPSSGPRKPGQGIVSGGRTLG